jgi:hypothetical protein
MRAAMVQAGERLLIECQSPWLLALISEACGSALDTDGDVEEPDLHLVLSEQRTPFDVAGWDPLTRGACHRDGSVVMVNACGSGFDLRVSIGSQAPPGSIRVEARFRPPGRERLASVAMRSRFHLLTRAVLLQYPAMWAAGLHGRMPLHAAAVSVGDRVALLAGPGGIGRSTLLLGALRDGGRACSDNLCVSDGERAYGLVEPVRIEGAGGRRMPHGRSERDLPNRVDVLTPDCLVVLRRAAGGVASVRQLAPGPAADVLVAGTFMAGELRRYWAFAATLALGTGRGPMHPPVAQVAALAARLPAVEITLGGLPSPSLAALLAEPAGVAS